MKMSKRKTYHVTPQGKFVLFVEWEGWGGNGQEEGYRGVL
jgi:hypothetical protein